MRVPKYVSPLLLIAALAFSGSAAVGRHTVKAGESLSGVALAHRSSVSALARVNDLASQDRIRAGQTLVIPGAATARAGQAGHIVRAGDTLASIARKYGTTVAVIAEANGIVDSGEIYVGARLLLESQAPAGPMAGRGMPGGSGAVHVVRPGETLAAIGARYGTTATALARDNGIRDRNRITAGTRLKVPGGRGWGCPVPGSTFMNDWGFSRSGGRFHEGTDLFAPRGTPVRAPVSGTVQQVTGSVGGVQFYMTGDDGIWYLGSHLDRPGASGRVSAGTVIGYVGDSGNARGSAPHLHFQIHPGGKGTPATNPYPSVLAACR